MPNLSSTLSISPLILNFPHCYSIDPANNMSQQVWLVTGCSSGFGEQFVKTIIERGDKAIATARNIDSIKHLADLGAATLQLDMTDSRQVMDKKVKEAVEIYGKIDVVVQNAGYGYISTLEDIE